MIIGNFTYDAKTDTYTGEIRTLTMQRTQVFLRPAEPKSDREPDYRIVEERHAGAVEFGAAWKRTSERGQPYLSIVFDDPAFPRSFNAALFPRENLSATLVWTRSAPKAKAAEPERPENAPRRNAQRRKPQHG